MTRPKGQVRIYDSTLSIWESPGRCDAAYENAFREDVFAPLVRLLRARGWRVGRDQRIHRNWPILDKSHRYCTHPSRLEATLGQCGRHIELVLFQSVANREHPSGSRYDFDKLNRMPYLLRLRAIADLMALADWLCSSFGYEGPGVSRRDLLLGQRAKTNRQIVDEYWAKSWHKRPSDDEISTYNRESADRSPIHIGERVWFTDERGRWMTGIAEPNINNMWWVLWGAHGLRNVASFYLHRRPPVNPRTKNNAELREFQLRALMKEAASEERFLRAEQLRLVLARDAEASHAL